MPVLVGDDRVKFWNRAIKSDGCWLWPVVGANGYGMFRRRGVWGAHRIAWVYTHGDIPPGMHVCHRCDVPNCINPEHLFLGTHTDNMRDMLSKGRRKAGGGSGFCKFGHPIDSSNGPKHRCCGTCRRARVNSRKRVKS